MNRFFLIMCVVVTSLSGLAQDSSGRLLENKLDAWLQSAYGAHHFNGTALVARGDTILLQKGYGVRDVSRNSPNGPNTIYQVGSITKSVTAVIVLKLQEQHLLSLSDRVDKYIPGFPHGEKITLENLLNHSSGLSNYTDGFDEKDSAIIAHPVTREMVLDQFKNKGLRFKPGSRFEYNNSGYFLLGMVIESVTGKPFEQVARKMIFEPCGMEHSGFDYRNLGTVNKAQGYDFLTASSVQKNVTVDSTVYFSAGALYSTTGDLFLFGRALASGRLLHDSSLRKVFAVSKDHYGYGFYSDSLYGRHYIRHSGGLPGFVAEFVLFPTEDITIVLLNNVGYYGSSLFPVVASLSGILFGLPVENWAQDQEISIDAERLKQFTGVYTHDAKTKLVVTWKKGRLFIRCTNPKAQLPNVQLYPEKECMFFMKEAPLHFEFVPCSASVPTKLITYNALGKDAEWVKEP